MNKTYWVYVGMFGCSNLHFAGDCDAENAEQADRFAWEMAIEEYESYAGYHGILNRDEIADDLRESDPDCEPSEEDIDDAYNEAVSDHVTYFAVEAVDGQDPDDEDFIEQAKPWNKED